MSGIKIDLTYCAGFFNEKEFESAMEQANNMSALLKTHSGKGSDFLGWMDLPDKNNISELKKIKETAEKIKSHSEYLINIGIGGSYLGAKALDDALFLGESSTKLIYSGNSISGTEMKKLVDFIKNKNVSINVVSKSGTTTEPAIAFRILSEHMHKKYGSSAMDRIFATTDGEKGAVKSICDRMGYTRFTIPDDIGGRYSVLTPVGLLPLAAAGADIDALLNGARVVKNDLSKKNNSCLQYAAARNILYDKGKSIEILAVYESSLRFFTEWWKQLFGESEGKEARGLFPASVVFSADLHSMGQYIQEGTRNIFETVVSVENPLLDYSIPASENNEDGLGYLAGKTLNYVNGIARQATVNAHVSGGVPNILLSIPEQSPYYLGQMIYFFEYACAVSGYMIGVNPFNQPGVEAYKNEMFRMLGKPGY